jgi:hypothetical protein
MFQILQQALGCSGDFSNGALESLPVLAGGDTVSTHLADEL